MDIDIEKASQLANRLRKRDPFIRRDQTAIKSRKDSLNQLLDGAETDSFEQNSELLGFWIKVVSKSV